MRADPVPARGGPVAPDAPDAAKAATREAPPRSLALQAPMRLASAVRDALAQVIQTLQAGHAPAQACLLAQGLFVPLDTWEQHGLQPSLVVRALCDAGMLAAPAAGRAATSIQDFNGRPTPGLLIEARFITGLAAAAPAPAGAGDP